MFSPCFSLWGLRDNVRSSSWAHWKARSGLLLMLTKLFSLGVTAEELRAIIGWKSAISFQRGSVVPKFHVERVAPHQPFFSEKWDKCFFVWYINLDRSFYRFVTMHSCDGQTDRRTEFSSLYRICITCSTVINDDDYYYCYCGLYQWHNAVGACVCYFLLCDDR